jgi:hypothetical protein
MKDSSFKFKRRSIFHRIYRIVIRALYLDSNLEKEDFPMEKRGAFWGIVGQD